MIHNNNYYVVVVLQHQTVSPHIVIIGFACASELPVHISSRTGTMAFFPKEGSAMFGLRSYCVA